MNEHAPFKARTTGSTGSRRGDPSLLMAAPMAPAGPQAAIQGGNAVRVAWPVRAGMVPPLAEGFTMRADSVPGIDSLLVPGVTVALVSARTDAGHCGGWPGCCGKTQLASGLAQALWQSRAVEFLAWVNAASRASVLAGFAAAARRLGLDHGGDAEAVAARVVAWLGGTARRWLVVLDNLRDAADLDGLWPCGPAGRVLVTARDVGVVPDGPGTVAVAVPAFSLREAMTYLSGRLTTDPDQRSGAYDLAGRLSGEPTALGHAAAVMADSGVGCRDYERYFEAQRERLRAASGREPPAAAVTWMLSADYAEELLPGGGTWPLLVLASLLDGHGIPRTVLTAPAVCKYLADVGSPADPEHAWTAMLALERAGLAATGPASEPAAWVSTPLQAAVRTTAPPELAGRAARAAADAVLEVWPDGQPLSWPAGQMRACAGSLLHHAGDALWEVGSCHRMLLKAGQSMSAARLGGPAAAWWREIAARCERLLGSDHPDTLAAAGQLAAALLTAGQAADAVHCARWVLAGLSRVLDPGHPAVSAARVSLGRALTASGQRDEALTVLREAAARSEHGHRSGNPGTPAALDEYAAAFLTAGDHDAAARFCKQSLTRCEQLYGPDGPATLAAALRLAGACLADGNARTAIGHYKRVLTAREHALGREHPDTLAARASLAAGYDAAGLIGDALREHQQACEGYERVLGPDHPVTLARQAALASAYHFAGQLGDAVAVLRDSISRSEQALSAGDPVTRELRRVLAGITGEMTAR